MKTLFIISLSICLFSCEGNTYDERVESEFNQLKGPVVLVGKSIASYGWDIIVKDGDGNVKSFYHVSTLATCIGNSHEVGDTLK